MESFKLLSLEICVPFFWKPLVFGKVCILTTSQIKALDKWMSVSPEFGVHVDVSLKQSLKSCLNKTFVCLVHNSSFKTPVHPKDGYSSVPPNGVKSNQEPETMG